MDEDIEKGKAVIVNSLVVGGPIHDAPAELGTLGSKEQTISNETGDSIEGIRVVQAGGVSGKLDSAPQEDEVDGKDKADGEDKPPQTFDNLVSLFQREEERMHGESERLGVKERIARLHFKNVFHTGSKVLSYDITEKVLGQNFSPKDILTRQNQLRDNLANFSCQNPRAWDSLNPVADLDVLYSYDYSLGLAMLESAEDLGLLLPEHRAAILAKISWDLALVGASDSFLKSYWKKRDEKQEEKQKFLGRLFMALFGGLALIIPMLIMTLHPGKVTSLTTTSVFVVAVAVALSYFMKDAQSKDIVGATAAYAAVLVVFVGTGTTTTS
ncbi:uncharacterized protein PAC_01162 [Phialocephala subalpina]|uniref:DUF6594 domain-containing protein n=1 Tax=Phialocephala subalpina TaxID=576137 RepID=A0A1L7WET0_9HELO|nr:uncharacterized protein PAC_01162 [Phialocephala subalpina]